MADNPPHDFTPRWTGCAGLFNEAELLDSRQNEEAHYRKHVVLGQEWGSNLSLSDYRAKAVAHLDSLAVDDIIEFCQADDSAVVKFNLSTGELGVARRDDGRIKTFFRPGDVQYVLRKVQKGEWGTPDIVDGFETVFPSAGLPEDPQQQYLFERLQSLSVELPTQGQGVIAAFLNSAPAPSELISFLARLAEFRFITFELRRRVLTSEQENIVFNLRKRVAGASASLEALERHRGEALAEAITHGLDASVESQAALWAEAPELILDVDMFENALDQRQAVGFALMEVRVLQFSGHLRDVDLDSRAIRVRRSDIYLRKHFFPLAQRFGYREFHLVSPEDFFWRRMAGL